MLKYIVLTIDIIVILFMLMLGILTSRLWTTMFWLGVLIVYVNMINNILYRPKGGDETTRPYSKPDGIDVNSDSDDTEIIIY